MSDDEMNRDEAATRAAMNVERAYTAGWRAYRDGGLRPSASDPMALRGYLEAKHAAELVGREIQWSAGETWVVGFPNPETQRAEVPK